MLQNKPNYQSKVVIIGQSGVGKTQLSFTLCQQQRLQQNSTIATDLLNMNVIDQDTKQRIKVRIWDTAGQQKFRTINKMYFYNSNAIIFVFSVIDERSFRIMKDMVNQALEVVKDQNIIVAIVANKMDQDPNYQFSDLQNQQIDQIYQNFQVILDKFCISAKTGKNILYLKQWLTKKLFQNARKKKPLGNRPIYLSAAGSSMLEPTKVKKKNKCCSD